MKIRIAAIAGALALAAAVPGVAEAASWWGTTTTSVNFRATPAGNVIGTIPASTSVHIVGQSGSWDQVSYAGQVGYVSGAYIRTQLAATGPFVRGPAPTRGFFHKPYWDNQHQAWYDGHRWYRNGIWYNSPSGFSIGFGFGG